MLLSRSCLPLFRQAILLIEILLPISASAHPTREPHVEFDSFTTAATTLLITGLLSLLVGFGAYYWLQKRALMNKKDVKKEDRLE